jgi:hypothetical protein
MQVAKDSLAVQLSIFPLIWSQMLLLYVALELFIISSLFLIVIDNLVLVKASFTRNSNDNNAIYVPVS